ncbi:hypothetical protein PILCRDRAFT_269273, partial [Piloderma croceum F 1598]
NLLTHSRFLLTLRSSEGKYHSLILFRLSTGSTVEPVTTSDQYVESPDIGKSAPYGQLYVMESTCPHLGADLSHAEIEECETSVVAVCPWHRYDFDLRTGKSETGLTACTYAVEIRTDPTDGVDVVWMETPEEGSNWRLVQLQPVSEAFADPPPLPASTGTMSESVPDHAVVEEIVPTSNAPTTLMQWAVLILNTADPTLKVQRTKHAVDLLRNGKLASIGHRASNPPRPPDTPPREENYLRNTVSDPRKLGKRKKAAVMLHALANIEQWAIDLAWDIMARFGPSNPDLPPAFFSDFAKMALDESKHFSLLTSRLATMSPSTPYGTLPVHASLWDSALITSNSLRARLAIIHLVHEARGLDVNPGTIERFRRSGDKDSLAVLEVIHADEVTHVTSGHRWFTWMCERDGLDPVSTFRDEVRKGWRGEIKGPFNDDDRARAGMTKDFYEDLRGDDIGWRKDADLEKALENLKVVDQEPGHPAAATVKVEYDRG